MLSVQKATPAQHHEPAAILVFSMYPESVGSPFTPEHLDAVKAWIAGSQMTFISSEANGSYVRISGTTAQVEAALHVTINDYYLATPIGRYYSMDRDPQVPVSLPIGSFLDISNVPIAAPRGGAVVRH